MTQIYKHMGISFDDIAEIQAQALAIRAERESFLREMAELDMRDAATQIKCPGCEHFVSEFEMVAGLCWCCSLEASNPAIA